MGVRAARRTSARDAEPTADVLVSGSDEPPWRPGRTHVRVAAALVLAAVAALVVPAVVSGDSPQQEEDTVQLALAQGAEALPRRDSPPVQGRVQGGVNVEVVNEGAEPVTLRSGTLTPGEWHVLVDDDLDGSVDPGGEGRLLRPGWSAVLVLHRTFTCTPGADHGPVPTSLELAVEVDGRPRTRVFDVPSAYGGGLTDLLGSPETFCAPDGGTAVTGTVGDPGLPFLPLWPASRGVLPVP